MPICHIKQVEIYSSRVYDDNLDNTQALTASTLEDDLNYIRTVLKIIGGGTDWYVPDIDESLARLLDDFQVEHYTYSESTTLAGRHKDIHADSVRTPYIYPSSYIQFPDSGVAGFRIYPSGSSQLFIEPTDSSGNVAGLSPRLWFVRDSYVGINFGPTDSIANATYADFYLYKQSATSELTIFLKFQQAGYFNNVIKASSIGFEFKNSNDTNYVDIKAKTVFADVLRWNRDIASHYDTDGAFYRYSNQFYLTVDDNFFIRGSGATTESFHFNTNNNSLGINKINPACNLDVNGTACISGNTTIGGDLSVVGAFSTNFLDDTIFPAEYNAISLDYNLLAGANVRHTVTVSGSGLLASEVQTNIEMLFDSRGATFTSANSVDPADPLIIEIDLPDVHTQRKKVVFGWISRYWFPTSFKVEVYDYIASTWTTVADETAWSKKWFAVDTGNLYLGAVRLTIRETAASDNRLQLSEVFLLHPEAAYHNDSGYMNIGYEIRFPAANSTSETWRTTAIGRNPNDKTLYMWAYANDYNLKFGSRGTMAAYVNDWIWEFYRRVRVRGNSTYGGKIYLYDSQDRYVIGIADTPAGRLYIAPYDDGAWQWGREFGYRPDTNRWYAETAFEAAAFYETSSRKYKEKIREYKDSAIELLRKVNVVRFFFKNNDKKEHIGFIAEEAPKEFVDETGEKVDTGTVLGILVKAVQELLEKLEKLEDKVAEIESH